MPVAGLVRLRKHLFGRQATFGTKVPATRAYAFRGTPSVDLAWTDPDVDVGAIVPVVAPQRGIGTFTAALTDPQLAYNTIPLLMEGVLGGNEVPTGGGPAKTWTHIPAGEAPLDEASLFTYEFGDDVVTDWYQLGDGILDSVEITGPEGLGALTTSMTWRFGSASSTGSTDSPVTGSVPTDLDVEANPALVYLKDMKLHIADTVAGLTAGWIQNALHTFSLTFTQENDDKRLANGSQTFDVTDRSRTGYAVELALTLAKTSATVGTGSESDDWFSDESVDRFVRLAFVSTKMVTGATPYSWTPEFALRYYTRAEADSAGNAVIVLTGHAFLDKVDFDAFFKSVVVCALTEADLGEVGS